MDAIDIAFKLHDGINFYWNFYVPACVAILGWVFSRKDPWPLIKRVAISTLFIGFTAFNLIGLTKTYTALDAVIGELTCAADTPGLSQTVLKAVTRRLDMGPWRWGLAFHIFVDLVMLYFIFVQSGKRIPTRTISPAQN